ncbi:MAG TPA: hypothetical protein VF101_19340 [Gaiellaceae bacterium]
MAQGSESRLKAEAQRHDGDGRRRACLSRDRHPARQIATCSTFIGDYIGLAFDTLGRAHVAWTDMRRDLSIPAIGRSGKAEDDMYARR